MKKIGSPNPSYCNMILGTWEPGTAFTWQQTSPLWNNN
jgi:hypothetical protein